MSRGLRRLRSFRKILAARRRERRRDRRLVQLLQNSAQVVSAAAPGVLRRSEASLHRLRDSVAQLLGAVDRRLSALKAARENRAAARAPIKAPEDEEPEGGEAGPEAGLAAEEDSARAGRAGIVEAALDRVLASTKPEEVLCTRFGAEITRRHLKCLLPGEWLNDEVINCYLRLVQENSKGHCWCPTSFFWLRLEAHGYEAVKRWARRAGVQLAALRRLLVPLHLQGTHWALGTVDFEAREMHYLDSLARPPPARLRSRLQEFLDGEGCTASSAKLPVDKWPLVCRTDVPLQRNTTDCGVFLCAYAERFANGQSMDFDTTATAISSYRRRIAAAILQGHL